MRKGLFLRPDTRMQVDFRADKTVRLAAFSENGIQLYPHIFDAKQGDDAVLVHNKDSGTTSITICRAWLERLFEAHFLQEKQPDPAKLDLTHDETVLALTARFYRDRLSGGEYPSPELNLIGKLLGFIDDNHPGGSQLDYIEKGDSDGW